MKNKMIFTVMLLVLMLSACAPAATPSLLPATEAVVNAPMPVLPTEREPVATEFVVTDLATYTEDVYGFTFDYPKGWMLDMVKLGDRAPQSIQLTSWTHEPGLPSDVSEIPADGTSVAVVVQLWDPKGDLAAFVAQRKTAWGSSGISIVSQEQLTLAGGRVAQEFVVQSTDGQAYFLLTVLGDQYLVVSGSGDLEAIRQVARSLR